MERRMLRYMVKVQRMEDSRLTRRVFEECWVERSWSGEEVGGSSASDTPVHIKSGHSMYVHVPYTTLQVSKES